MAASDNGRGGAWPSCRTAVAARGGGGAWGNGGRSTRPPAPGGVPSTATSTGISIRRRGPGSIGITFRFFPCQDPVIPAVTSRIAPEGEPRLKSGPPSRGQAGYRRGRAGGLLRGVPDRIEAGSLRVELRG